jgi:hypothetical protein
MKPDMRPYLLKLLIFTALVAGITALAWLWVAAAYLSPALPFFPPFFFLITLLVHRSLIGKVGAGSRFVQQYMIITVAKLLLFMGVLIVYALLNTTDAIAFTVAFLFYYLSFTTFEVVHLMKAARANMS